MHRRFFLPPAVWEMQCKKGRKHGKTPVSELFFKKNRQNPRKSGHFFTKTGNILYGGYFFHGRKYPVFYTRCINGTIYTVCGKGYNGTLPPTPTGNISPVGNRTPAAPVRRADTPPRGTAAFSFTGTSEPLPCRTTPNRTGHPTGRDLNATGANCTPTPPTRHKTQGTGLSRRLPCRASRQQGRKKVENSPNPLIVNKKNRIEEYKKICVYRKKK